MKAKPVSIVVFICIIGLVINACDLPGGAHIAPPTALTNPEVPTILMVRPLDGSIFNVGVPLDMSMSVRSVSTVSISETTFLVNGASIGAADSGGHRTWTPPHAGEYYIQSRVVLNDGTSAVSSPNRICVLPLSSWSGPEIGGYMGFCTIPTRIPDAASSGDITINAFAGPSVINVSANPSCNQAVNITIVARVDDPQDQVAFATYGLYSYYGVSTPYESFLNWITTRPVNQKEYRATEKIGAGYLPLIPSGGLRWIVKTLGRDGQELNMTGVSEGVIPLQSIQCDSEPLQISPTLTPAPMQIIRPDNHTGKSQDGDSQPNDSQPQAAPCNPLIRVCP